jgi:hypothetical protein
MSVNQIVEFVVALVIIFGCLMLTKGFLDVTSDGRILMKGLCVIMFGVTTDCIYGCITEKQVAIGAIFAILFAINIVILCLVSKADKEEIKNNNQKKKNNHTCIIMTSSKLKEKFK